MSALASLARTLRPSPSGVAWQVCDNHAWIDIPDALAEALRATFIAPTGYVVLVDRNLWGVDDVPHHYDLDSGDPMWFAPAVDGVSTAVYRDLHSASARSARFVGEGVKAFAYPITMPVADLFRLVPVAAGEVAGDGSSVGLAGNSGSFSRT